MHKWVRYAAKLLQRHFSATDDRRNVTAMAQNELLKQIVKELERAKSPSTFCTHGKIDFEGADVSIDGVGKIELPMRTVDVKRLFPVAVQAPYGKRTETIVDTNCTKCWFIPRADFFCLTVIAKRNRVWSRP